ncbi:MAG: hypothetical protein IPJ88_04465 [Myxococcales bacterium]|nr:MAG: hypothetical protein IPJ88_04465 [Myxococcales bacterium]
MKEIKFVLEERCRVKASRIKIALLLGIYVFVSMSLGACSKETGRNAQKTAHSAGSDIENTAKKAFKGTRHVAKKGCEEFDKAIGKHNNCGSD